MNSNDFCLMPWAPTKDIITMAVVGQASPDTIKTRFLLLKVQRIQLASGGRCNKTDGPLDS